MTKLIRSRRIGSTSKLAPSVSGFIFNAARDSILLVQRTDNRRWCLPSGHIEPGESIVEACQREVREETGLETVFKELLGVWSDPDMVMEYPDGNRFQCLEIDLEMELVGVVDLPNICFSGTLILGRPDETINSLFIPFAKLSEYDIMETELERIKLAAERGAGYIR